MFYNSSQLYCQITGSLVGDGNSDIIARLHCMYVLIGLGCNDATKNCSLLIQQLNLSLRYVFPDLFDNDTVRDDCNLIETDLFDNHNSIRTP